MKRLEAIIAATLVTGAVALCMLLIGLNALLNPSAVRASNAPGSAVSVPNSAGSNSVAPNSGLNNSADQAQITELQNQISQYQQQLDQANTQLQQYQQVMIQLQQSGVIRIGRDGTILLRAPRGDDD